MTLASRLRALRWPAWLAVGTFYGVGALGLVVVAAWEPVGPPPAPARLAQVAKDQARVPAALAAPWADEEPWQQGGGFSPGGWHRHHYGSRVRLGPPVTHTYTHTNRRGRR